MNPSRPSGRRRLLPTLVNNAITLVGCLLLYFALPVRVDEAGGALLRNAGLALLGVVAVAWIVVRQVRGTGSRELTALQLVVLLEVITIAFALAYYSLAVHAQGEFEGIATKLDALYFTLATMTTAGFGDIRPMSQLARGLVSAQLAFDVVFLGLLATLIRRRFPEPGS